MKTSEPAERHEVVTELIEAGKYVAKVQVTHIYEANDPTNWAPYLSVEDVEKLEKADAALRAGDLGEAAKYGKVYELKEVA